MPSRFYFPLLLNFPEITNVNYRSQSLPILVLFRVIPLLKKKHILFHLTV